MGGGGGRYTVTLEVLVLYIQLKKYDGHPFQNPG